MKKPYIRRTLLVLLAAASLLLASCDVQPTTQPEKEYTADPSGYAYTIVSDTGADDSLFPRSGTLTGDRLISHYKAVQAKLGCTITASSMFENKIVNRITSSAAANTKFADLVQTDAMTILSLYKAGYLTALENVPFIDTSSEKWGLASQRGYMSLDGKSYGFYGLWLGASFPTVSGVMLYNRSMLAEYAVSDPLELYENSAWIWHNFRNIAIAVTSDTGDDSATYAFACPNEIYPDFIYAAIASNGGSRCVTNEEGVTVCGYNGYATIDALDWVRKLVTEDKAAYPLRMGYDNGYLDILAFTNLRTAFLVTNAYNGIRADADYPLDTLGENLGWLPFPSGTGVEPGVYAASFSSEDSFYAIAVTDMQSVYDGAQILDAVFEPFEDTTSADWQSEIESNYFFGKKYTDIFLRLLSAAKDDGSLIDSALNTAIDTKFADVVNGYESAAKAVSETESVVNSYLLDK